MAVSYTHLDVYKRQVLPLGTKVIIGETVYTVEDIGSSVDGHTVDLYFSSHQEALAYGVKKQEVFQAIE